MSTEAANLFVKVTGDISDASSKLGQIGQTAQKTGGVMKGALSTAIGFGAASIGISAMGSAFGIVQSGVIGMNASLETSTLQFTTLMGDSEKAQKKVESLFEFAAKTPFETGPIIKASRTMQTFGGDVLNTDANLRLFGDAAAAVSQPIDDVSFWMSRAYAAIQGGQPFGEARMRLMEMGIITPQVAAKMEKLSASGASADKIWGSMTGALGKFDGAMETQSQTFDGMMSTFTDGVQMMLAKAGKPLFEMMKNLLKSINDVMSSPAFQGALAAAAEGLGAVFGALGSAVSYLFDAFGPVITAVGQIVDVFMEGDDVASGLGETFDNLGEKVSTMATTFLTGILGMVDTVMPQLQAFGMQIGGFILDALPGLVTSLAAFAQTMFDWILNTGVPMLADTMSKMVGPMIDWITGTVIPKLGEVLPQIATTILDFVIKNVPKLIAKLVQWGGAFIGWIGPQIPKILVALAGLLGSLAGWVIGTGLPKILGLAGELGLGLIKGFLQFVIGPPGLLEKIATFITGTLIPGIIKFGPKLLKAAGDIAGNFVKGFIDFMSSLPGKVADMIRKAFGNLHIDIGPFHISASGVTIDLPNIGIPGFATGSWNVPMTGPALIHKGEMIIPADLAARLRGGSGIGSGSGLGGGVGGGLVVVNVNVGNYYGTQEHLTALSKGIGAQVRLATPRRTTAAV